MALNKAQGKVIGRKKAAQKAALAPSERPRSVLDTLEHPDLTAKQDAYVKARAGGLTKSQAVKAIGANSPSIGTEMEERPKIQLALQNERKLNAQFLGLTRDDVLQGLKDAIEHAKLIADPGNEIAGWREIAKICGFYAPEVKKIQLTDGARRYLQDMEALPDDELLKLANGTITDVDFTEK